MNIHPERNNPRECFDPNLPPNMVRCGDGTTWAPFNPYHPPAGYGSEARAAEQAFNRTNPWDGNDEMYWNKFPRWTDMNNYPSNHVPENPYYSAKNVMESRQAALSQDMRARTEVTANYYPDPTWAKNHLHRYRRWPDHNEMSEHGHKRNGQKVGY